MFSHARENPQVVEKNFVSGFQLNSHCVYPSGFIRCWEICTWPIDPHLQPDNVEWDDTTDLGNHWDDDRKEEEANQARTLWSSTNPTDQAGEKQSESNTNDHICEYLGAEKLININGLFKICCSYLPEIHR